jgi:hypothetical protein
MPSPTMGRRTRTGAPRHPDFVIIGTMKSGTTTLHRWLDAHPCVAMPANKEPNYFINDRAWHRGPASYTHVFSVIPAQKRTGEASVAYTDPVFAERAADRLESMLPAARLVCLLREPESRLRSHYRHEVLRGREVQSFQVAVSRSDNAYVRRSSYRRALDPWLRGRTAERLLVVTSEELFTGERTWHQVLDHLGLDLVAVDASAHNVTATKPAFTPTMRRLWDAGLVERMPRPPAPVRRLVRPLLLRSQNAVADLLTTAEHPLPTRVSDLLAAEVAGIEQLLGRDLTPWPTR